MGYQEDHIFYIEINDRDSAQWMERWWMGYHRRKHTQSDKKKQNIFVMQREIFSCAATLLRYFLFRVIQACDTDTRFRTHRPQHRQNTDEMTVILDGNIK